MVSSDTELLRAWKAGDNDAGNALVQRYFWVVFRFFSGKVHEGADDLTQRTFMGCVESRERVREDASLRAYLLGIARNKLLEHYRKVHREHRAMDLANITVEQMIGPSPSRVAVAHQEQRVVLAALRRLPLDFQITIELFYWEDLSTSEIAEVLQVAPGTVKSRLARARDLLKQHVAEIAQAPDTRASALDDLEAWTRSLRVGDRDRGPAGGDGD